MEKVSINGIKEALLKAKDKVVTKSTIVLDANGDGSVDIQDIIILAIKIPGVHVNRESFLRKELLKNHSKNVIEDAIGRVFIPILLKGQFTMK